jgi:hypothetical protein
MALPVQNWNALGAGLMQAGQAISQRRKEKEDELFRRDNLRNTREIADADLQLGKDRLGEDIRNNNLLADQRIYDNYIQGLSEDYEGAREFIVDPNDPTRVIRNPDFYAELNRLRDLESGRDIDAINANNAGRDDDPMSDGTLDMNEITLIGQGEFVREYDGGNGRTINELLSPEVVGTETAVRNWDRLKGAVRSRFGDRLTEDQLNRVLDQYANTYNIPSVEDYISETESPLIEDINDLLSYAPESGKADWRVNQETQRLQDALTILSNPGLASNEDLENARAVIDRATDKLDYDPDREPAQPRTQAEVNGEADLIYNSWSTLPESSLRTLVQRNTSSLGVSAAQAGQMDKLELLSVLRSYLDSGGRQLR